MISDLRNQIKINEQVLVLKKNMKKIMDEIEEIKEEEEEGFSGTEGHERRIISKNPSS